MQKSKRKIQRRKLSKKLSMKNRLSKRLKKRIKKKKTKVSQVPKERRMLILHKNQILKNYIKKRNKI